MTESLDKILLSPGLYWIGELIFVEYLESDETFANCELVCKKWQQFFIQANLWKRRIFCRMAKPGTYRRSLLERYPTWSDTESLNCLQAQSSFFRTLAFKFSKKSILSSWKNQKFSIRKVANWPVVRDLAEFSGQQIIFAQDTNMQVANKNIEDEQMKSIYSLKGHRREITCLDFDEETQTIVTGGRDRNLITWNIKSIVSGNTEKNNSKCDAHERLITSVKIYENCIFSSSRDRSVKVWDLFSLNHLQTLVGHHGHSVWGIDVRNGFLVTASADKSLNVWQNDPISKIWNFKHKMDNDEAPLRNVIIFKKMPFLALSGDLLGDLKIWNLESGQIEYQVPDPLDQGLFRRSGGIVSLSQTEDVVASAFADKSIALFSTLNCSTNLEHLISISLNTLLNKLPDHSFIRNIYVCDGQVYICNVSGKYGIIVLSIWE